MGYYRGDYYRGDYYRGDPGIFGTIGKAIGGIAKVATNLLPGPLGAVARTVIGAVSAPGRSVSPSPGPVPAFSLGSGPGTAVVRSGGGPVQARVSPLGTVGVCGPGMRLKKDGGCTGRRHPRMNVGNARAANRAIRRIKGVRHMLRAIEAQLPKVAAKSKGKRCGCK